MPEQYRRDDEYDDRRGGRRDWRQRAGDEIRSWFGDGDGRARRGNDEQVDPHRYGGDADRGGYGDRWSRDDRWSDVGRPYSDRDRDSERSSGSTYGDRDRFLHGEGDRGWRGDGGTDRGYQDRGVNRDRLYRQDPRGYRDSFDHGSRWADDRGYGRMRDEAYHGSSQQADGDSASWSAQAGRERRYGNGGTRDAGGSAWPHGDGQGRESFSGRGPKGYKRSDDRIREEVSDRLTDDDLIDASEITVQVQDGEVTLTGSVASRHQKRYAEDLVASCSGVSDVTNNLRVARSHSTPQDATSGGAQTGSPGSGKSGRSTTGVSA